MNVDESLGLRSVVSRGIRFFGVSSHPFTLRWPDGTMFVVPPSGLVIRSDLWSVDEEGNETRAFDPIAFRKLTQIRAQYPKAVIIGSKITATEAGGVVYSTIPLSRMPRISKADEFMNGCRKVTIYPQE